MATPFPTQNIVQMFLDGQAVKKKHRRPPKTAPPTARFSSRHGSIEATLRVTGDSSIRSTSTIRAETRSGNVLLDLVSRFALYFESSLRCAGLHRADANRTYRRLFTQRHVRFFLASQANPPNRFLKT